MENPSIPCELCGIEVPFDNYIGHVEICQHRSSILNILNPMLNSFLSGQQVDTVIHFGSNNMLPLNSNIRLLNIEDMLDSYELNNMISEMIGNVNHGVNNLEEAIRDVSIDEMLSSNDNDDDIKCSICLDSMSESNSSNDNHRVVKTTCHHFFHRECIVKWLREHRKCPLCQKDFNE